MSASLSSRKRTLVTATSVRSSPCSRSAIPPNTSCQRPDSSRSQRSASASSAGFPWARPSQTTMLSTASTRSPSTARSFRSAFWSTSSRGSPSVSSSTSGASTRKSTPSCSRIARRRGELEARISRSELREEQADLAPGGLRRIRAVDQVRLHLEAEVAADRSRCSFDRVRDSDHLPGGGHGLVALEHHRDQRPTGDEIYELAKEGPLAVLRVVPLGELPLDRHVLHRDDREALALEARDDLAGETALERVGLDEDERAVHQPADCGRSRVARAGRSADGSGGRPDRLDCEGLTGARRGRGRRPSDAWPTSASQ